MSRLPPWLYLSVVFWLGALFTLLGGCASRPAPPPTALIPIRAACVPADFPAPPASYADDALPAGPAHLVDRYRLRGSANEARKARLSIVEPVILACRNSKEP